MKLPIIQLFIKKCAVINKLIKKSVNDYLTFFAIYSIFCERIS